MGKRSAYDSTPAAQQQTGGPKTKRARLNGQRRHPLRRNVSYNSETSEDESSAASSSSHSSAASTNDKCKQSPKPEFQLTRDLVAGTILTDLTQKDWRIGSPIGKGSFGEIFLASDNTAVPVTRDNAKYVVKIEPHSNGPLFVEIHCLLNTAKNTVDDPLPPGMPEYIASGSHYFKNIRYRFLVLRRFDCDLHSIIKRHRVDEKSVLVLAVQILDILEHLHDKGYCHSDIKAENLMISKCTYHKKKSRPIDLSSDTSSDTELHTKSDDDSNDEDLDDDDDNESEYRTPTSWKRKNFVPFSGSNPVRSCRLNRRNVSTYQELVNSHYLRPTKKINYTEFDENSKSSEDCTIDEIISRQRNTTRRVAPAEEKQASADPGKLVTEDRIFLIDFGLASKFIDSSGNHRPFCMDQRRAHDGTLEFTSRDAHLGAHSRRSDLECLGYNLIYWSQGYLPWKETAAQQQHEKVHWMKEYLMTDVREMLKQVYGKSVPKYLGEYMHYVGSLAYHERPNYDKYRRIFQREYSKLGAKCDEMVLNVAELKRKLKEVKDEVDNNNEIELKNLKSIMKNLGILLPFRESSTNRVSPKNLRSMSEKQSKSKRKKFCWAEILSQDPDQIARERAEKEFEREPSTETPVIRYSGKPTYAILEIENRIKFKDRLEACSDQEEDEILIKGYTKPMMEILRKRQSALLADIEEKKQSANHKPVTRTRAKAGLRTVITPTKRGLDYSNELGQRRAAAKQRVHKNSGDFTSTDESSCSSLNSVASSTNSTAHITSNNGAKKSQYVSSSNSSLRGGGTSSFSCPSSSSGGSLSDEDTRDSMMVFSPKRTRYRHQNHSGSSKAAANLSNVVGSKKRKKSIPRKRNGRGEFLRCV